MFAEGKAMNDIDPEKAIQRIMKDGGVERVVATFTIHGVAVAVFPSSQHPIVERRRQVFLQTNPEAAKISQLVEEMDRQTMGQPIAVGFGKSLVEAAELAEAEARV